MGQSQRFNWRITPYQVTDLMDLRDKLRYSRVKNVLLFCEFEEIALKVVQMAIDEDLMTDAYHWMLGNIVSMAACIVIKVQPPLLHVVSI